VIDRVDRTVDVSQVEALEVEVVVQKRRRVVAHGHQVIERSAMLGIEGQHVFDA
jgi:hypothetical protein